MKGNGKEGGGERASKKQAEGRNRPPSAMSPGPSSSRLHSIASASHSSSSSTLASKLLFDTIFFLFFHRRISKIVKVVLSNCVMHTSRIILFRSLQYDFSYNFQVTRGIYQWAFSHILGQS